MDYDISINSLVLEITRRCNMECAHCMRGNPQNIDMSFELVDKIVDLSTSIGHVTFTGGEPTLNLPLIKYAFDVMLKKFGYLPPFYIATNGKANQVELAHLLMDAYFDVDEKEMCGVAISRDRFHELTDERNYLRLMPFYDSGKEHPVGDDDRWVLDIGSGKENGVGMRAPSNRGRTTRQLGIELYESELRVESCTITATGDVLNECDYAYNDTADLFVCKLNELEAHLAAAAEKKEKEEE